MIRINRIASYADKMRSYKVILDNKYLGEVHNNEIKDFEVEAGNHTIFLKIDWCRSNKVDFYISQNELIEFECANSMKGWRLLLSFIYIIFLKDKYLWIKRI